MNCSYRNEGSGLMSCIFRSHGLMVSSHHVHQVDIDDIFPILFYYLVFLLNLYYISHPTILLSYKSFLLNCVISGNFSDRKASRSA